MREKTPMETTKNQISQTSRFNNGIKAHFSSTLGVKLHRKIGLFQHKHGLYGMK